MITKYYLNIIDNSLVICVDPAKSGPDHKNQIFLFSYLHKQQYQFHIQITKEEYDVLDMIVPNQNREHYKYLKDIGQLNE